MQYDLFAVADAALQSPRSIGAATNPACFDIALVGIDFIVDVGALPFRRFDAEADLYCLDRWYRHQCRGESAIELAIPRHMGAKPDRHAIADDLGNAAEGVALCFRGI